MFNHGRLKKIILAGSISLAMTPSVRVFSQSSAVEPRIYDGSIEGRSIILLTESDELPGGKGYFVLKRNKAIEESHTFSMEKMGRHMFFQSDLFSGKIKKAQIESGRVSGTIAFNNRKKRLLFWPQTAEFNFVAREDPVAIPDGRYKNELFDQTEIITDLSYGKAVGYWTESPYSDDPYIETLAKGMIKSFKDPSMLDLKLDLYLPQDDSLKLRPLVMLIHGGAFYIGSKQSAAEKSLADDLVKRGYVVASINYRLGFKPVPKDIELSAYRALQDAHAALRYLASHSIEYGIDPQQVYVGGTSAGAVASLNLAFMKNEECPARIEEAIKKRELEKIESSGNDLTTGFSIKAVLNMWGAVADLAIIDENEKIPVLSIHGTADEIVPFEHDYPFKNSLLLNRALMDKMYGSKPIHDRLEALGIRNKLFAIDGLGHEPELETYSTLNHYMDTITNQIVNFLKEETAPRITIPEKQLSINNISVLKPFYYEIENGLVVDIKVKGGVKANSDPADFSIIWFKNATGKQFSVTTANRYDAVATKTFYVKTE